jgi:hydroxypyruvate reductase
MGWADGRARAALRAIFDAAVAAADPRAVLAAQLPEKPRGRCVVVGAGKSAAAMAAALEAAWPDVPLAGVVVTRYGHAVPTRRVRVIEAAHPVPDANGEAAARAVLDAVRGLGPDDLVLALISGGGSALLALPAPGLTLADKQAVSRALLASGATIHEMNAVRKHLSAIKGGRLAAAAAPARVVTLAISDVPGDDPAVIGSGPTVPDPTTLAEASDVLTRFRIEPPAPIAVALRDVANESPKPGDPAFANAEYHLVARPADSFVAAEKLAREAGIEPILIGDNLEGEAREVAAEQAARALELKAAGRRAVLLSGGELTVTMRGQGRGGPNQEYALALAEALGGAAGIYAVAGDTDGTDGGGGDASDPAGAFVTPNTLARAAALGLDPASFLANNDSTSFFERIGDLLTPGPTCTNVNDFRAVFVDG